MDSLRSRLQEETMDLLWDQWSALGVAGRESGKGIPFVVDPEALLLATIRFGSDDGRLLTEVPDWLERNGGLISLQRLKNLQTSSRVGTRDGLENMGSLMEGFGFRNWKSVASWAPGVSTYSRQRVEFSNSNREMSQIPDCDRMEAFLLRMRGIFGVSARPEILTWLFTHREGYAAQIARDTGWFSKSVQAILNDLEFAKLVVSSAEGKRKVYALSSRNGFVSPDFLSGQLCWFSQAPFYLGLLYVMRTLDRLIERKDGSESARAIAVREEMTSMNAAFRQAWIEDLFAGGISLTGKDLVQFFVEGVEKLLTILGGRAFA